MTSYSGFLPVLLSGGVFAVLLVAGARAVRRISANDPTGRHWLLRTLAVLSPLCLLASLGLAAFRPLLSSRPATSTPGLAVAAVMLMDVGALISPLLWRMLLQRRLGRSPSTLPFFHASRTSLLVLYVLALIYMAASRTAAPVLQPWLDEPGLLQGLVRLAVALVHVAMLAALITFPVMALRAGLTALARRIKRAFARSPTL
ncbi:MAG: hypothetical protein GAK31_01896 [Stenotrophomonas maltophilia]|uniref:Transmembrane protein n=1 Tax=Stenotrophomonas maltophilia TaxID=40324 RepID=A0A7V8FID4_STEMA|nr:MAG: hypothetical protein GAK31_01896 [Stenotrophomonas maltophilia]